MKYHLLYELLEACCRNSKQLSIWQELTFADSKKQPFEHAQPSTKDYTFIIVIYISISQLLFAGDIMHFCINFATSTKGMIASEAKATISH